MPNRATSETAGDDCRNQRLLIATGATRTDDSLGWFLDRARRQQHIFSEGLDRRRSSWQRYRKAALPGLGVRRPP